MCGRYDLSENPAAIRARFDVPSVPDFTPNADLRPTDRAPIVRLEPSSGARECALARWGLVPAWAKDLKIGARCFNARIETLASLAAFRDAYRSRRCLVPASAFFEWSGPPSERAKWRIFPKEQGVFALAGLWERWRDARSGEAIESYTIVTADSNGALAHLHDRMPVIVAPDLYAAWLDPGNTRIDRFVPVPETGIELAPASGK